jgi:GntR family transcriptional repressor for pyruvate dehydrogenase complex
MPSAQKLVRPAEVDVRATSKVLSTIKEMIADGKIAPGGKFPPERELAKQLKVNRATLRQVMKLLELMGVITQRVGDGTYLSANSDSIMKVPLEMMVLIDDIPASDLFETRMIVEPELASRAATRATSEDMAALRQTIIKLERSRTQLERVEADAAFHGAIYIAGGNRICRLLFQSIHRLLLVGMTKTVPRVDIERPLGAHKKIYAAIRDRNADEAKRLMLDHIMDAAAGLQDSKKTGAAPRA